MLNPMTDPLLSAAQAMIDACDAYIHETRPSLATGSQNETTSAERDLLKARSTLLGFLVASLTPSEDPGDPPYASAVDHDRLVDAARRLLAFDGLNGYHAMEHSKARADLSRLVFRDERAEGARIWAALHECRCSAEPGRECSA